VNTIFRLFDQKSPSKVWKIGRDSESKKAQGPVRNEPRRHFRAIRVLDNKVSVSILRSFDCVDIQHIGQGGLNMTQPVAEPAVVLSETVDDPRQI
jgi:hypothetical protein